MRGIWRLYFALVCAVLAFSSAQAAPAPPGLPSIDVVKPVAESGEPIAQRILGLMYAGGFGTEQNYPEAIKWLRLAADQGDGDAQFLLGDLYREGKGTRRDYAEAVKWFRLAAGQGVAEAQFRLGWALYNAEGVERNYADAAKWYRLAAAQGVGAAHNNLGVLYSRGHGVPQNIVYSFMWYLVGATAEGADNDTARINKNRFRGALNADQIRRATEMATRCIETKYQECGDVMLTQPTSLTALKASAEKGDAEAEFQLALAYQNGLVVAKDDAEAAKWYELAAGHGHKNAQFVVGGLYFEGKSVPQNNETASLWWRRAAEQGVAEAQASLGTMYFNGHGVPKDNLRAYMWLDLAAGSRTNAAEKSQEFRDAVATQLTPSDLADAKALAARCKASSFKSCE